MSAGIMFAAVAVLPVLSCHRVRAVDVRSCAVDGWRSRSCVGAADMVSAW